MLNFREGITVAVHIPVELLERIDEFMTDFDCSWDTLVEEAVGRYIDSFPTDDE